MSVQNHLKTKKTLTDHLLTHPKTKEKCDKCGKFYKNQKSLKEHERNVHEGKLYSCDVCTKSGDQKLSI